jgi:hypothetical protein
MPLRHRDKTWFLSLLAASIVLGLIVPAFDGQANSFIDYIGKAVGNFIAIMGLPLLLSGLINLGMQTFNHKYRESNDALKGTMILIWLLCALGLLYSSFGRN